MKRITILGATGSIGTQTLDVVRRNSEDFEVVALTASENVQMMAELIQEFRPSYAVMRDQRKAEELRGAVPSSDCEILCGMDGFIRVSTLPRVEMVVAAMVGMIGLRPVMEAIRAGKDIALANKETLVTAGHIIMPMAKEYNVRILPIDSEHSAIFQCLNGEKKGQIETIYLTASGGPFRHCTREELKNVTVEQALAHPNWFMGPKITVDSATMINKGLEMIEAKWLFDVELDRIHVLVQPQSIIHSMVGFRDGAVMAQMGTPDMRLPIRYALTYPYREKSELPALDLLSCPPLTFAAPDLEAFPCLKMAMDCARTGGTSCAVLNGANEAAVELFRRERIAFGRIPELVARALDAIPSLSSPSLEEILEADRRARECVAEAVR